MPPCYHLNAVQPTEPGRAAALQISWTPKQARRLGFGVYGSVGSRQPAAMGVKLAAAAVHADGAAATAAADAGVRLRVEE